MNLERIHEIAEGELLGKRSIRGRSRATSFIMGNARCVAAENKCEGTGGTAHEP